MREIELRTRDKHFVRSGSDRRGSSGSEAMKRLASVLIAFSACHSTPPPIVPPDADAASPPVVAIDGAATFEMQICTQLAASGCSLASCPSTILANKLPNGGYATPWAACLYSGVPVANCRVPCQ